jgi:hypothetical protein
MKYIFDKMFLAHEIIDWARCTKQEKIFLKLDFAKAYDKVSWDFLFLAMKRLGMDDEFIDTIKLLFQDAKSSSYLNGNMTHCFQIRKGVRHECPLLPYLFLLVGEILNILIKQLVGKREICRMVLIRGEREKILSQYAHDTTFTLVGSEDNVNKAMEFFNNFLNISRLKFN